MNYSWDWAIFFQPSVTGEGLYGVLLAEGVLWTVSLSLLSWILALALGTLMGIARASDSTAARWASAIYVHCFRNTPLLVQLFLWYFVLPELLPIQWGEAIKQMNPTLNQFLSVVICLTLYTTAGVAEQVRTGLQSLSGGQANAAKAIGLGPWAAQRYVLLPQAFRIILPSMTSDFMNVFKNSAAALTIGLMELTGQSRQVSEFSGHPFESFIAATLIYMVITYGVVIFMRRLEKSLTVPGLITAGIVH
ncbi:glutamate ABC transporter permease [Pseudomonas syringae]|uniref:Glutamate ABC transporter permease n=1 Tax=Pseudomonas syringae TaxID=317 RepID=A0A1C7Z2E4_PSESX|nr:amino acid ABC transporter permease [Pseudomonas syringae]OCR22345.1 glutamate ABC transporter permease [Pseudomonas syringae]